MPPKRGPDFAPAGAPAKTPFDGASTYTRTFVGHPADKPAPAPAAAPGKTPFDGISTYTAHYVPKGLAGVPMPGGFKIPYPRENLGFMIVNSKAGHVTMPDLYKDMIFHATRLPTKATAVCTTVYDNQDTVCVLILMGNSPRGSDNLVLGQFDITNIPPQPYGQPKFEVTFSLSHDSILAVECRDLDGPRHKAWLENGGKIVVVQGA